jgi:hypothetical protein
MSGPWRSGFVPLGDLTVDDPDQKFTDQTKAAYVSGWYRLTVTLPDQPPPTGQVTFADGRSLAVPLVSSMDAYRAIDKGDPPCGTPPSASADCTVLTVTGARLGTVSVETSRGKASAPAWLFTVDGLPRPVARIAVASSALTVLANGSVLAPTFVAGLVSAMSLSAVDRTTIRYTLGVGDCDDQIRPLVYETGDAIVIGGSVHTRPGVCDLVLRSAAVEVTLAAPAGDRVVLDALTGQPLVSASPRS